MIVDLESTLHKTPRLIVEGCLVKWFAAIERRKLTTGDYAIAGLEERVVVPDRPLCKRVNA